MDEFFARRWGRLFFTTKRARAGMWMVGGHVVWFAILPHTLLTSDDVVWCFNVIAGPRVFTLGYLKQ